MSGLEQAFDGSRTLLDSKGYLDKKYRDWCLDHPTKFKRTGNVIISSNDELREVLLSYLNDFHETSPELFNDILQSEDINAKNDAASVLLREKGNGMYQSKQFKVCSHKMLSLSVTKNLLLPIITRPPWIAIIKQFRSPRRSQRLL